MGAKRIIAVDVGTPPGLAFLLLLLQRHLQQHIAAGGHRMRGILFDIPRHRLGVGVGRLAGPFQTRQIVQRAAAPTVSGQLITALVVVFVFVFDRNRFALGQLD